jgi:N,N'-diacetyllegionaminate synthase
MSKIIVEIGLNHLGDEERAGRMLKCAADAGADAVTFQIREAKFYESEEAARKRLSIEFYAKAGEITREAGMEFGLAIADEEAVSEFASVGVDFWKSLSWDYKNLSLRNTLQATGKKVLMSTGLSSIEEILEGSKLGGNIELIHTQLTQEIAEVNLKAIAEMRQITGFPVAFGLHCSNHDVMILSLAFEPSAVLFYLKEEGSAPLFDDQHAIAMNDLAIMISKMKALMPSIGTGHKDGAEKPSWVVQ